jgi:hypothetical protein
MGEELIISGLIAVSLGKPHPLRCRARVHIPTPNPDCDKLGRVLVRSGDPDWALYQVWFDASSARFRGRQPLITQVLEQELERCE